jgi:NADH dehydrogenase
MAITELPSFSPHDAAPAHRVVILGAGYGGLRCAQMLSKYLDDADRPEVVLLDRYSYHQIITELPLAAGGRAGADDVSVPLDDVLRRSAVRIEQAEAERIDLERSVVVTTRGELAYGTLVVAVGSITAFYGVPGLAESALTLKSVEDAETINRVVRSAFSQARATTGAAERANLLSFLIGGAGLTGVELAGELAEVIPSMAASNDVHPEEARVTLIEASPQVLPSLPEKLRTRAAEYLTDLGVRLVLGSKVVAASTQDVALASGERLAGRTLIWTGGIMAPPLLARSGLTTTRHGQVMVDEYLRVPSRPNIYAIGDAAQIHVEGVGGVLEPTAQVALKQAEAAAYNIVAEWSGRRPKPYAPASKGLVVSVGSESGGASIFNVSLTGRKVMALKTLIQEGYRYSVTGRIDLSRL